MGVGCGGGPPAAEEARSTPSLTVGAGSRDRFRIDEVYVWAVPVSASSYAFLPTSFRSLLPSLFPPATPASASGVQPPICGCVPTFLCLRPLQPDPLPPCKHSSLMGHTETGDPAARGRLRYRTVDWVLSPLALPPWRSREAVTEAGSGGSRFPPRRLQSSLDRGGCRV